MDGMKFTGVFATDALRKPGGGFILDCPTEAA